MTRALLCGVLLLSVSCGSSSSDDSASTSGGAGNTTGGAGNTTGGAGNQAGSANQAGSGNQSQGGASNTAGTSSSGGASTTAGAGGTSSTAGTGTGGTSTGGTSTGGTSTGGTSTGGTATGGTGGTATGGTGTTSPGSSVTQWGGDIQHTSHWVHSSLTKANMAKMAADTFTAPAGNAEYFGKFAGELAALPLFLAGTTAGAGEYIAVTTQNDVYAFNETTGALVWKRNIGANIGAGGSICGSPANHGIVSTPVIDATARVIYLTAGLTTPAVHHEIHALAADSGKELTVPGWPVDVSKIKAGAISFDPAIQIQRSAMALVGGTVYVAFGGYCGDQGEYHGWVIGVNSQDPTKTGAWATMDTVTSGGNSGIWAPGGMASDGNGVFAVTGNAAGVTNHTNSDSEEVIRVTGLGVGNRTAQNMFFPPEFANPMNSGDLDFGSSSPAVVTVPSSKPSTVVVAPSKNGRVYFLDASNLGGSSGQFADLAVASVTAASVYTSPSAYQAASGVYVAVATGTGSQCPGGNNNGSVMSILMQPGATATAAPTPKITWCAAVTGDTHRSPISTNSAGSSDPIVWFMNGTKLNAFDGETGTVVFNGGTGTCGGVHSMTTLIAANGHLVAGGDAAGQAHLCSWSVHN